MFAQSARAGGEEATIGLDRLSEEAAAARLDRFRTQRLQGDYRFDFELAHKPYRSSRTIRFEGTMWGTWEDAGPVTRFRLFPEPTNSGISEGPPAEAEPVEMIVRSGSDASAWVREPDAPDFRRMAEEATFDPVIDGVLHRPFDLQMPFLNWRNHQYEGPGRIGARAAVQYFLVFPPSGSAAADVGIYAVRLAIDDDYNALKRIEVLDGEEFVLSEFTVIGVKKVDGQYIPSRISLKDMRSGDRTDFRVLEADVGMRHNDDWFDPEATSIPLRPEPAAD